MTAGIFFGLGPFAGVLSGGTVTFTSNGVSGVVATPLDAATAITAYIDTSDSNKGKAVVVSTISGTPSVGSVFTFFSGAVDAISITALSSTAALIGYIRGGAAKLVVVTGLPGSPSVSAETAITGAATIISVSRLTSTTAISCYINAGNSYMRVLTSLGGTPSVGSEVTIDTSGTGTDINVAGLSSTNAVALYARPAGRVIKLSSLTGSPVVASSNLSSNIFDPVIIALSGTTAIGVYGDSSDSDKGKGVYLSTLTGSPTLGTPFTVNAGSTNVPSVYGINDDSALITFRDQGDSNKGKYVVARYLQSTAQVASEIQFSSAGVANTKEANIILSPSLGAVFYADSADSNKGKMRVLI